jgi:hypothetical protein
MNGSQGCSGHRKSGASCNSSFAGHQAAPVSYFLLNTARKLSRPSSWNLASPRSRIGQLVDIEAETAARLHAGAVPGGSFS